MANNAAFEDLELDISDMLSDPEAFAQRVYDKADELRAICKADHSVNAIMAEMKTTAKEITQDEIDAIEDIYVMADELPLECVPTIITRVKKLLGDLETMMRDKAIYESANRTSPLSDKRVAHAQYSALREKFAFFVKFNNSMFDTKLELLPPMTGNYGPVGGTFNYYVFNHETHGEFRNHRAVIDKIRSTVNVDIPRDQTLMDFIESEIYEQYGWTVTRTS